MHFDFLIFYAILKCPIPAGLDFRRGAAFGGLGNCNRAFVLIGASRRELDTKGDLIALHCLPGGLRFASGLF